MESIIKIIKTKGRKATCECECGNIKDFWMIDIEKGKIKSCGCLRYKKLTERNTTHGKTKTRLYRIWRGIISRCGIESATSYSNYGGRGILVCEEWKGYIPFEVWAISNGYKDSLTIERIDVNGHYNPSNCKWISKSDQAKNKRKRTNYPNRDENGRFIKNV